MADLTQRDAAYIERDRLLQFSQYGAAAVVKLFDKEGNELRTVARLWNRYRKTTREQAVYFLFKIADLNSEFESDMRKLAGGFLEVLKARYRVTRVTGWEPGESRIWNVTTNKTDAPAAEFYRAP